MTDLYDATVPVFTQLLRQADRWIDKATAYAADKTFDPELLVVARLAPDQYALDRQIQSACDYAKMSVAKLAGKAAPAHADTEKTLAELRARIASVVEFVGGFARADFAGADDRPCSHTWMQGRAMRGADYLHQCALPNFYFHLTSAYAILRHNGVPLGKMDYLGKLRFI